MIYKEFEQVGNAVSRARRLRRMNYVTAGRQLGIDPSRLAAIERAERMMTAPELLACMRLYGTDLRIPKDPSTPVQADVRRSRPFEYWDLTRLFAER